MWQLERHLKLMDHFNDIKTGDIVAIEHGWVRTFALLPRKTISGRYVWFKWIYCRRVWVYTGFVDEPEIQHGELFDVLANP